MTGEFEDDPSSCATLSISGLSRVNQQPSGHMSQHSDSLSDHDTCAEGPHLVQLYARLQQRLKFAAYKVKLGLEDEPFDTIQHIVKDETGRKWINAVTSASNFVNDSTRRSPLRTRTEPAPCFDMDDLKFEDGTGGYGQEEDPESAVGIGGRGEAQAGPIGGMVGAWSPSGLSFMDTDDMDEPNLLSQPLSAAPETYYSSTYAQSADSSFSDLPFPDFSSPPSVESSPSYRKGGPDRISHCAYPEKEEETTKRKTNLDSPSISYPFQTRIPTFTKSHTAPTGCQTPSYAKLKDASWVEILEQARRRDLTITTSSSCSSSTHKPSSSHHHNETPSNPTSRRNSWAGDQDFLSLQSRATANQTQQNLTTLLESLNRLRRDTSAPLPTTSCPTSHNHHHNHHHHHHNLATSAPSYYPNTFLMPGLDVSSLSSTTPTILCNRPTTGRDSTRTTPSRSGNHHHNNNQSAGSSGSVVLPGGNLRYVPPLGSSLAVPSLQQVAASLGVPMGAGGQQQRGQRDWIGGLTFAVSGKDF